MTKHNFKFPIGYHKFHKNQLFNFTLSQWYSIGYARYKDMLEAGKNIKKYEYWKPEMISIADKVLTENRLMNAVIYYRSAEFSHFLKILIKNFCMIKVIGFKGPGQGVPLIKAGLAMDINWEKPTSAILDYFNLDDVTLIGLSVGGWLCLRAAAFEPRIKRVVASGYAIHYMEIPPAHIAWMFEFFMKFENLFNKSAYWKMEKNPRMKSEISQTMHITKSETPFEGATKFNLSLSEENMHADKIKQDVLFFTGNEDHFIPLKMHSQCFDGKC